MESPEPFDGEGRNGLSSVFTRGYRSCIQRGVTGAEGHPAMVRLAQTVAFDQTMTKDMPSDTFGATVLLARQTVEVRHNGRSMRSGVLPVGCLTLEAPGVSVRVRTSDAWDAVFFLIPVDWVRGLFDSSELPFQVDALEFFNPPTDVDPHALEIAKRAGGELRHLGPFTRLRADLLAQEMIIHMLQSRSNVSERLKLGQPSAVSGGLAPWRLRRAFEAMDALPETEITLDRLACAAECSPTHFSRAFKRSTGMSPFAWLLNRRVERAKTLLRGSDTALAEVALAVGFAAQPQFTTAFKRLTGLTPGAWRLHHRH